MMVTKHAIVMTFGALVACIGIVLFYLRKEQARNRIRLFGQDLQISTPDLLVFMVKPFSENAHGDYQPVIKEE